MESQSKPERLGNILARLPPRATPTPGEPTPPGDQAGPPTTVETCPLCQGMGWVGVKVPVGDSRFGKVFPCACLQQKEAASRHDRLLAWAELSKGLQHLNFDAIVREQAQDGAMETAFAFARGELPERWLVLSGGSGTAKTHLAVAVLLWRIDHPGDLAAVGKYVNVPDMLDDLRAGFRDDSYEDRFDRYRDVALLVLDDLGAQNGTPWAHEKLYQLLDKRGRERMETVVTTNMRPDAMPPRIADRILDTGTGLAKLVTMDGASYRSGRRW